MGHTVQCTNRWYKFISKYDRYISRKIHCNLNVEVPITSILFQSDEIEQIIVFVEYAFGFIALFLPIENAEIILTVQSKRSAVLNFMTIQCTVFRYQIGLECRVPLLSPPQQKGPRALKWPRAVVQRPGPGGGAETFRPQLATGTVLVDLW